ncbi:MAG: hypothetical protein O6831_08885 [Alphaproteobacteria bacterium]|nr:hypothetical protein [Alphaproteobacteria bacterium]MCZ6814955.1 hypothetical protein [Alphaproteobacteria bacterium]
MAGQITNMPSASVLEDGSVIEMVFADEDGERPPLRFAADDFERFVARAVQLVTEARTQKLASGGHLSIHAVPAVVVTALAPVGGDKVILSVHSDKGLPYHFSLSPKDAEDLRPELFRAAKSAKKQASQSRH